MNTPPPSTSTPTSDSDSIEIDVCSYFECTPPERPFECTPPERPRDKNATCMNCDEQFKRRSGGWQRRGMQSKIHGTDYTVKQVLEDQITRQPLTPCGEELFLCGICARLLTRLETARDDFLKRSKKTSYLGYKRQRASDGDTLPEAKRQCAEKTGVTEDNTKRLFKKDPINKKHARNLIRRYANSSHYDNLFPVLWRNDTYRKKILHNVKKITAGEMTGGLCNYRKNRNSYMKQDLTMEVLETFDHAAITEEAERHCPMLFAALSGALRGVKDAETRTMMLASIVSQIAYAGRQTMRLVPQLMGVSLWGGMVDQETMKLLNSMKISVGPKAITAAVKRLIADSDRDVNSWKGEIGKIGRRSWQVCARVRGSKKDAHWQGGNC